MPELPEVETIVRGLRDTVLGETIARVRMNAPPSGIAVSYRLGLKSFASILKGKTILEINRRGKNILIQLSENITLWVHLKMTGHFHHLPSSEPIGKHDLVVFDFDSTLESSGDSNEVRHLRFNDYRRFGRLRLYPDDELWQQPGLKLLGPEPLEINAEDFVRLCNRRPRTLKLALLDQHFLAGIGNIYADETLFAARLHPRRVTTSISTRKLRELHGHIQRLLRLAISKMGTSVDSYSGVNGEPGSFQTYLKVYGREGEACVRCSGRIVREKIGSRSAHYCPRCQRKPATK